jgi:hypothetical protein
VAAGVTVPSGAVSVFVEFSHILGAPGNNFYLDDIRVG